MTDETQELKDLLRLFREFHSFYVVREKLGAGAHHPIWQRIVLALGDDNLKPMTEEEWRYVTGPYFSIAEPSHV